MAVKFTLVFVVHEFHDVTDRVGSRLRMCDQKFSSQNQKQQFGVLFCNIWKSEF